MWSDRPAPAALLGWAEAVRGCLPRARAAARRFRLPLAHDLSPPRLAWPRRRLDGFAWLDGGDTSAHVLAAAPVLAIRATDGTTSIRGHAGEVCLDCDGWGALEAAQIALRPHAGGARLLGYLGYELASRLESLPPWPAADLELADLELRLHDCWLEVEAGRTELVGVDVWRSRARLEAEAFAWLEEARAGTGDIAPTVKESAATRVSSEPDAPGFEAAVARTVRRIHSGEIFQTNLCRRFAASVPPGGAWDLYLRMRSVGDAAHGAFLSLGAVSVLSRSPESYLHVRSGLVESRPIKGTRPRGADPETDAALRRELLGSTKDRAELAMIVDLVRNDLGRVCAAGTVEVIEPAALLELSTLWHTFARIRGRLDRGVGPVQLLRASFPPGSITGAPKIQAMTVAIEEEPHRRGPAMGAIGWLEADGDLDLSVAIRTAVVAGERVVYHAGGGIVADSDPRLEQEESLVKARTFLAALRR